MKRLLVASVVLAFLIPVYAFAESAFSGTWKTDPTSMHTTGGKPMVISMKDGMFTDDAAPPVSVKADGQDHAVSGHPEFDMVAIKVIDDHTLERTQKKDGKVVWSGTFTVAADGKTATGDATRYKDGAASGTSKMTFDRVGKMASGSNPAAGSWRMDHMVSASDDAMVGTYQVDGDKIDYKDASGSSYSATIGGKAAPFMDHGKANGTVTVKSMGKNVLRETYETNKKMRFTSTMTMATDGKTMKTVNHYDKSGATDTSVATKE